MWEQWWTAPIHTPCPCESWIIHSSPCLIVPKCTLSFARGPNQKIYYKTAKTNKQLCSNVTQFICSYATHTGWGNLFGFYDLSAIQDQGLSLPLINQQKENPGFLSARKQHFWKLQNPKHCSFIQFLSSSVAFLTPVCARENKCGLITHAAQSILSFFHSFYSQKTKKRDDLGDMWSPKIPTSNQTQEPQCSDSALTTTDSCCDSVLFKATLCWHYQ